jgi:hypothetical protein
MEKRREELWKQLKKLDAALEMNRIESLRILADLSRKKGKVSLKDLAGLEQVEKERAPLEALRHATFKKWLKKVDQVILRFQKTRYRPLEWKDGEASNTIH